VEQRTGNPWQDFGAPVGATVAILIAGGLVGLRPLVDGTSAALVLVLVIVGAAAVGGQRAALATALAAAVAFDFFHTEPYGRLSIDSANDAEIVVLLVLVGLVSGEIVTRARLVDRQRALSHRELLRVHRVAETVSRHPVDTIDAAVRELRDGLGLQRCWYEPGVATVDRPRIGPRGTLDQKLYRISNGEIELPDDELEIAVRASGEELGRFVLVPTPGVGIAKDRRVAAAAIADLVAVAMARSASPEP
jgi:hypothetical protein